MESQQRNFNTKIENLKKSIADNFEKMFQNKYTQATGKSKGKEFPDLIFLGKETKEYIESLEKFFNLKRYNKNDIEKSNLLEQESPLFFLLQSLLVEKKSLSDNRFNKSNEALKKLTTPEALNQLLEKLKEFMGKKLTQKTQLPVYHSRPNSTMNKEDSQKSLDSEELKVFLKDLESKEFEALSQCLYNGFNLYGLIETLYYFTEIKKIIKHQLGDAKKDGNKGAPKYDVYTFEDVEKAPVYKKCTLDNETIEYINKNGARNTNGYSYFKDEVSGSIIKVKGLATKNLTNKLQKELIARCQLNKSQELFNISEVPIENFVKRLVNNFKDTFGSKIEEDLKEAIESISAIPSGVSDVFDLLKKEDLVSKPLIISQLEQVQEAFKTSVDKLDKKIEEFIGEQGDLTKLFKHFGIESGYFDNVKKSLQEKIKEYTESLKQDVEKQIKEKEFFIGQISEQYLSAYNSACNDKALKSSASANDKAPFISNEVVTKVKNDPQIPEKIKENLPLWIRQGINELTYLTIKNGRDNDKEVGFILNKSQKTIIDKLKEFANPSNLPRSQTQSFYLGTGGGKTYLNELISGAGTSKIQGSDGEEYKAEDIKKAIFGDLEPHIISINFHQIKNKKDFESHLAKFNDATKKNILILDEYHLFPEEVRNNLKDILKDKNIFVIKSTATPTPEELYYKNLKREILGDGGTKKLFKDTYNEIQGKIKVFLSYEEKPQHSNDEKYHLIIDSAMTSSGLLSNKNMESCNINTSIKDAKPDIKIFGFKDEANQDQFFIEEKEGTGSYKKVDCKVGGGYSCKNFSKDNLKKYLNKEENKNKKYQIYYPDSISAGGDFGIGGGAGETKITIVIDENLLKKPATEIVNYVLQAVGRDRYFKFEHSNSFANVKFIDENGNDNKDTIKQKFTHAKEFYDKNKGDANPLLDYLQNKFKNIDDKKYIALFYKTIKDNPGTDITALIESFKKSFDNPEDFKKFESLFVAASIISKIENSDHKFTKDIKSTAEKITNLGCVLKNKKIIDSFKEELERKNLFFNDEVTLTSCLYLENAEERITVNYKIKATNSDAVIFSTNNMEQQEKVNNLLVNCNIKVGKTTEFLYNQTLKSLEVEKANEIKTLAYNTSRKRFENNGDALINHEEGDKAISLEAKAILHLFNKVLEERLGFSDKEVKLIEGFFKNNSVGPKQQIPNIHLNAPSYEEDKPQVISGKQQADQALTPEQKLEIIKAALSQRNKYNPEGGKNTDANRAQDTRYQKLKTTLQDLNKNSINFTTESLKLFNDCGKTLGTRKEVDNLIEKKPLFVRAMGSADINKFKKITKNSLEVNGPSHNILLAKPELVASKSVVAKLMQLKPSISKAQ